MSAKLLTHRRQHPIGEIRITAGTEALIERGAKNRDRHRFVDGSRDRPSPLTGIRHAASVVLQTRAVQERGGSKIQQPRADHAASAPDFRDLRQVQVILVILRVPQRRRFGIRIAQALTGVGVAQDVQPFGISRHEAILNAVVDHLYEVARAGRAAMQISVLDGTRSTLLAWGARRCRDPGRDALENRVQVLDDPVLSADHQTVAALQPEHPAAGAAIDVMYAPRLERLRSFEIVAVVAIAAVDDDVTGIHARGQFLDCPAGHSGGKHHPDRAWFGQLRDQLVDRDGAPNAATRDLLHRGRAHVVDDALVAILGQAPHQTGSHTPQADHAELHLESPSLTGYTVYSHLDRVLLAVINQRDSRAGLLDTIDCQLRPAVRANHLQQRNVVDSLPIPVVHFE